MSKTKSVAQISGKHFEHSKYYMMVQSSSKLLITYKVWSDVFLDKLEQDYIG